MLKSKIKRNKYFIMFVIAMATLSSINAQTVVSSLAELQDAIQSNNQNIVLNPGNYNIEVLPSNSRYFHCTGSNNTIDLTGTYIEFPVDATSDQHFLITGSDNVLRGGVFENTYGNGMTEVTDYVAYNNDRNNFANGGDPHIVIQGDGNTVVGMKLTIRGSFPYGYGSMYGINNNNQFGLSKRGGIAVQGTNAVIDSCELQMQAFGHAIYIQSPSNHTIIKNTIVIGDLRLGSEIIAETDPSSLPSRSNFMDFSEDHENPVPIDPTRGVSLCEDGIRLYNNGGSMHVENCRVEKMRGGIRGYLGSGTTVVNSTAIDCESTNFNLPSGGSISNSYGNFAYSPLSDYRLSRSNTDVELTIMPSPHASGSHNLMDLEGNNHNIVFHRTPGSVDSDEERAIVITGDNSTIVNETEYTIILESSANGNDITSCGPVTDNGSGNSITNSNDCEFDTDTETLIPPTTDGNLVHITKRNATGYAIDGGTGGANRQNVTLSSSNTADEGQLWLEIDRGDGFYSYEKYGTNYSLDGNREGANNQSIYLWETNATNQNQQWQKVAMGDGGYKLIKRNATGFAINGGSGGVEGRDINLWSSASTNQNLQWYITPINTTTAENVRLEAEDYDSMSGIQTEASSESGDNVGWVNDGDWIRFDDVNLSGISNIDARVATRTAGGTIEVRTGSATGTIIGSINVSNTGGFQNWTTVNTSVSNASGTQDVYLVFTGGSGYLFNVNWVEFNTSSQSNKDIDEAISATSKVSIYPNPVSTTTTIENAGDSEIVIYNMNGIVVFTKSILSDSELIDLGSLSTGFYCVEVRGEGTISMVKLVKE